MENLQKYIYELETLGFTIVENVFNTATINELKDQIDVALENDLKLFGHQKGKNPDLALDLTIHSHIFIQALDNDVIQELCSAVLGNSCTLYSFTSTILRPNKASAVQEMHIDTNKYIPNYITGIVMTVALDDFTFENGATLYLAGSQNSPLKPSEETFAKYSQTTARKAGDVLFFNPRVYHRAGNNNTDKVRYGMTMYATHSFFKPRFDFPRMIPKTHLQHASERLIKFLGYDARVPRSVDAFYLPADERRFAD